MPTIDEARTKGEKAILLLLSDLDAQHAEILRSALRTYGRVDLIPESVWNRLKQTTGDDPQLAKKVALLMLGADSITIAELQQQADVGIAPGDLGGYARHADELVSGLSDTVDTIRDRLKTAERNSRISGPGELGEFTPDGIDKAISDVLDETRRATIATDLATQAISKGQMGAGTRAGQVVDVELVWVIEDNTACPICLSVNGTTEDVWGLIFPDGPGPEAHPNCRCRLRIRYVATPAETAA